jgi:hypothetical protein
MASNAGRWGRWSTLLAGLPYDVQAALYNRLAPRNDLTPDTCYRLPLLFSVNRLTIPVGGTATSSWRFLSLSAIYGISKTFSNETLTAGNNLATLVYPDEVNIQVNFNEGATVWIGSNAEPCSLGSIGDSGEVTRVDPIIATRNDVWDLTLTGQAGMLNAVFGTVTLHGVKIYNAGGAI